MGRRKKERRWRVRGEGGEIEFMRVLISFSFSVFELKVSQ